MKAIVVDIEEKIDELLNCLEGDIEHIENSLLTLDKLRGFVIKHDKNALGKLLEKARNASTKYRIHERKRQQVRSKLAKLLNCSGKDITLSNLETVVSDQKKGLVVQTKIKLNTLTRKFLKEYTNTAMLLSECTRFNRLILKSIFNFGNTDAVVYDADGTAKEQNQRAFMDLQL
jgi:hypothetical protein